MGLSLGSFGASQAVWVRLGCIRGVLWVCCGASGAVLEASLGHLGLEVILNKFPASWEIHENCKSHSKNIGFSLIFGVPRRV